MFLLKAETHGKEKGEGSLPSLSKRTMQPATVWSRGFKIVGGDVAEVGDSHLAFLQAAEPSAGPDRKIDYSRAYICLSLL